MHQGRCSLPVDESGRILDRLAGFEQVSMAVGHHRKHSLSRMALGNPLGRLQQAFAPLLARFHKKSLWFRWASFHARFDAAGAVAGVV